MAHKEKYTRGAIGHMLGHYDRTKKIAELPHPENMAQNYNLAEADQPYRQLDYLHRRLGEVKVHNRKDVNVMVDWVITLPQGLDKDDEKRFFQEAYSFLNNRYGKENVISAYVHLDEVTPHMHYAFVPVVEDKKKGGYKLSAKEAVTRRDLQTFHKDLSNHMERVFGRDIGILNDATKEGNKSIEELKRGTAKEELKHMALEAQKMRSNAKNIKNDISIAKHKKISLERQIEGLEKQFKGRKMQLVDITAIQPQKTLTGAIRGISLEDIENLKAMAIMASKAIYENKTLLYENERLREEVNYRRKIPLSESIANENKEKMIKAKAKAFDRLPEEIKDKLLPQEPKVRKSIAQALKRSAPKLASVPKPIPTPAPQPITQRESVQIVREIERPITKSKVPEIDDPIVSDPEIKKPKFMQKAPKAKEDDWGMEL